MPAYHRYLYVACAAALVAVYTTMWLSAPTPLESQPVTVPPLRILQGENVLVWGSWRTVEGYDPGTFNGVEIICNRERQTCLEAYAELLRHDSGEDLAAKTFSYEVTDWSDRSLIAIDREGMGECVDRILHVELVSEGATLEWRPGNAECDGDVGKAVLVGDPL